MKMNNEYWTPEAVNNCDCRLLKCALTRHYVVLSYV